MAASFGSGDSLAYERSPRVSQTIGQPDHGLLSLVARRLNSLTLKALLTDSGSLLLIRDGPKWSLCDQNLCPRAPPRRRMSPRGNREANSAIST